MAFMTSRLGKGCRTTANVDGCIVAQSASRYAALYREVVAGAPETRRTKTDAGWRAFAEPGLGNHESACVTSGREGFTHTRTLTKPARGPPRPGPTHLSAPPKDALAITPQPPPHTYCCRTRRDL